MLLQAGASRYAKNSRGKYPLQFCLSGNSMACLQLLLGTAPDWNYTPEQLNDSTSGVPALAYALKWASIHACKLLIHAGADTHAKVLHEDEVVGYADLAHIYWPDRPELAALFDPDTVQEPFTPPCCAGCQKSGVRLRACSKCHAVRYCSTACQRAHWRAHKQTCITPKDVKEANAAKYNQLDQPRSSDTFCGIRSMELKLGRHCKGNFAPPAGLRTRCVTSIQFNLRRNCRLVHPASHWQSQTASLPAA